MSYDNLMLAEEFASLVKRDPKEILRYMMEIAQASREFPDKALIIPYNFIPREAPQNVYLRDFGRLFSGVHVECRLEELPPVEEVFNRLNEWFNIEGFTFDGYVLAGSAAVLACSSNNHCEPSDGDFYPYYDSKNLLKNSVRETILVSYRKFLEDVEQANNEEEITTFRNKNCTTVVIEYRKSMQIIHRAHTSARSTIVGFDQMACKAFFDGEMVYFTIDAALCLYFGINPVDWRRESPSHMARVLKYQRYEFVPIFPHLSFDFVTNTMKDKETYNLPSADSTNLQIRTHGTRDDKILYVDFSTPYKTTESDYDGEHEIEDIGRLGLWYHATCMLIKQKFDLFPVFSDKPTEILDNAYFVPLEKVLNKVAAGRKCVFYFGDERTIQISNQIADSLVKVNGRSKQIRIVPLNKKTIDRVLELQNEYVKIVKERKEELEASIPDSCHALLTNIEFNISNPGAQFTASFKPIRRETPQDYWGPKCVEFECNTFYKIKFTLLCIRHRLKNSYFGLFGKDLMLLLFSHIYRTHFKHEALVKDNFVPIVRENNKSKFPWHDEVDSKAIVIELVQTISKNIQHGK